MFKSYYAYTPTTLIAAICCVRFGDSGVVPHDLGSPSEDPYYKTNIYNFQVSWHNVRCSRCVGGAHSTEGYAP